MTLKNFCAGLAVLFLIQLTLVNTSHAQIFEKGTKLVDAGFEFTNGVGLLSIVPVFGHFEIGATDDIGIGARVRFWSKHGLNALLLQPTASYHFNRLLNLPVEQLDLFGSLGLGFQRVSGFGESATGFIGTPYVGGRYFFTEMIGAVAKIGIDVYVHDGFTYGDANFSVGVSLKF